MLKTLAVAARDQARLTEIKRINAAPRLLHARTQRLETPPRQESMHEAAISAAGKWISGAILMAGAMMSIAIALH